MNRITKRQSLIYLASALLVVIASACAKADSASAETGVIPLPEQGEEATWPTRLAITGDIAVAGTSCFNWDETPVLIVGKQILIPIRSYLKREANAGLKRGSCQFALPVQVPAGFQLHVTGVHFDHVTNLAANARHDVSMEVFFAGSQSPRHALSVTAGEERQRDWKRVDLPLEGLKSGCGGEGLILRGNSSLVLNGGDGSSTAKLDNVILDYDVIACEPTP